MLFSKYFLLRVPSRLCAFAILLFSSLNARARETVTFDSHWQFHLGDAANAQAPDFPDTTWRTLDLPHDWSIELPFDPHVPAGGAGAFIPTGVGWYRKHFTLPVAAMGTKVWIEFDGVTSNADVYLNGDRLGHRPYFGISFRYDLTPHLRPGGQENMLAVRVDNSKQPASRWYTGSGINRHVRLVFTDPVHVEASGLFVSTPQISDDQTTVHFSANITNDDNANRPVSVKFAVGQPGPKGLESTRTSPRMIPAGESAEFTGDVVIKSPQRWEPDQPILYSGMATVRVGKSATDRVSTPFGIREFHFDPDTGFSLNGQNFKLKGVCVHEDLSALGTAVPMSAWRQRLSALRKLGVNAIRTAHNPPSPDFLDLCDREGFLVMDEMFDCWTVAKNPYDYHLYFKDNYLADTRSTVLRDRNHPCIILYSAGNEIHDTPHPDAAKPILAALVKAFHESDPTRPVTQALFRPNVSHDYDNGLADLLDVVGQNYRENEIVAAHAQKPARKIVGTENGHDRKIWLACRDNPPYAGQFLWTGLDYLGESRDWPIISSTSGLIDRLGFPRPMGYERQSWWSTKPMVYITRRITRSATGPSDPGGQEPLRRPQVLFSDWTPKDLGAHDELVEIYSNCKTVELFLNDTSLGTKERAADEAPRTWKIPFTPGTLEAIGANDGKSAATYELKTAGAPAQILLTTNTPSLSPAWDDVAPITATITDANNIPVPTAANEISFTVTGPGVIYAVDNADPRGHESFRGNTRHAYQSRCQAILKSTSSTGQITLTASSPNLSSATITLQATEPK